MSIRDGDHPLGASRKAHAATQVKSLTHTFPRRQTGLAAVMQSVEDWHSTHVLVGEHTGWALGQSPFPLHWTHVLLEGEHTGVSGVLMHWDDVSHSTHVLLAVHTGRDELAHGEDPARHSWMSEWGQARVIRHGTVRQ